MGNVLEQSRRAAEAAPIDDREASCHERNRIVVLP